MNKCSEFLFLELMHRNLVTYIDESQSYRGMSDESLERLEMAKHDKVIILKKMKDMGDGILEEIEREDDVKFKFLK